MGMIGTFETFTTARLGIYSAQKGLSVTGNNISNINTVGYTRQRLDQVSLKTGANDVYRSHFDNHIGSGALVRSINQIRDPYLDIRYRAERSSVGYTEAKQNGLDQIASILDEVGRGKDQKLGDGILYAQLQEFADSLRSLSANAGTQTNDTLARTSADALVSLFNTYAGKLETLRQNTEANFKDKITAANEILNTIRDLNDSIRKSEISGDNALELRDERNRQIDELSELIKIDVIYSMEDIGAGQQVEKLTIKLGDANPDDGDPNQTDQTVLIDGIYGAQLELPEQINGEDNDFYLLQVTKLLDAHGRNPRDPDTKALNDNRPVVLDDNDLYGSLQAIRELLTESGEFAHQDTIDNIDENATIKRGIPYYQKALDLMAQQFAKTFNDLNTGTVVDEKGEPIASLTGTASELGLSKAANGYYVDPDGNYVPTTAHSCFFETDKLSANATEDQINAFLASHTDSTGQPYPSLEALLADHGTKDPDTEVTLTNPVRLGGVLFSTSNANDDPNGITAANISISHSWSSGDTHIVTTYVRLYDGSLPNTTQNENVNHMVSKIDGPILFNPQNLDPDAVSSRMFEGSFNDFFSLLCTNLGNDQRSNDTMLDSHYITMTSVDTSRDSVSGVDLNDEAMNMIQYQKAYSAACRLMTAIDEALDRLINNTGIAGR